VILARYVLAQFFPPLLFGMAIFSGVLVLDKVFDLVDLLVNKDVSLLVSAKMFLLFLPTVLTLTVPMAVLLACLLTFGRLSEDNEVTAMRASGLSFFQILWPPLALALLLSAAMVPFNTLLVPKAMNSFRSLYHHIVTSDPLIKIEPRRFIGLQNIRLYAGDMDAGRETLKDVLLYQFEKNHWQRIYAARGTARVESKRLFLSLDAGQLERFSLQNPRDLLHVRFRNYTLSVPFSGASGSRGQSWRELTLDQLKEAMRARREAGQSAGPVAAELHLRFAISFSALALALLGVPLGIALEKGGRGVGFGASLGVVFAYYLVLILGLTLAEKEALPPLPALWAANVLTAAVGIALYRRRLLK
jgi:lipopolysaccharide export system permease protein